MEQSIKDKYKLSEEEHNKIYKEIEKEVETLLFSLQGRKKNG